MSLNLGLGLGTVRAGGGGAPAPSLPALNPQRAIPLNIVHSGASHTNLGMPAYVDAMAEHFGGAGAVTTNISIINGSSWRFRWENGASASPTNARALVEAGTPDVLAICSLSDEGVGTFSSTGDVAVFGRNWRDACEANSVEMYMWSLQRIDGTGLELYANPLDVPNNVWANVRNRLTNVENFWRQTLENLRNTSTTPGAQLVRHMPWARIFAKIIDEWLSGNAPSGFRPEQMLGDVGQAVPWYDNHPSALGRWCIALMHFAVIWRRDCRLVPLPGALGFSTSGNEAILGSTSAATYEWLAGIIWSVCENDPRTAIRDWEWILEQGQWSDIGTWEDTFNWKDAA